VFVRIDNYIIILDYIDYFFFAFECFRLKTVLRITQQSRRCNQNCIIMF